MSISDLAKEFSITTRQHAQTQLLLDKVDAALADLQAKRSDTERAITELGDIRAHCISHLKSGG